MVRENMEADSMRRFIAAMVFFIIAMETTLTAEANERCHELVMSYIEHDQDPPQEPGDVLHSECDIKPVLMHTTAYCEGSHGSHGDRMKEGYCAAMPEQYGQAAVIYEAIQQEDGSYRIGSYLCTLEIKDCGYGFSTGSGKSTVRPDKAYAGTIESGLHIDVYRDNLSRCWQWMKKTRGFIFVEIIPAKG